MSVTTTLSQDESTLIQYRIRDALMLITGTLAVLC